MAARVAVVCVHEHELGIFICIYFKHAWLNWAEIISTTCSSALVKLMGHSLTTFQNTEFCLYEWKICLTNISFATFRLINHSWDRIKCLASCFVKNIFFLRLLFPWGGNICLYRHNTLNADFLTFSST
jgi:hypothetical protein